MSPLFPLLLCVMLKVAATPNPAPAPESPRPGGRHVSYGKRSVAGLTAHVLTVNLREPTVRIGLTLAPGLPSADAPWQELLSRSRPVAAINGTFFDKESLRPIGDLVVEGALRHAGRMGTVLAVTPDNRVTIRRVEWGRSQDWSAYRTVLGCGPTLVREGKVDVQPEAERFRDPHVLGASNRSAAGVTAAGKLLLISVTQSVRLEQLARAMIELGCVDAMNLDGGASMAMYYRGRTILPPGRRLTNILTVYEQ